MNGTFQAAATPVTASGNSSVVDLAGGPANLRHAPATLSVLLHAGSVTGTTPSLTVEVQWSNDGTTFVSATTPDNFTAITAAGSALKSFTAKARYARLLYTVTGTTPSFALDATAYAA